MSGEAATLSLSSPKNENGDVGLVILLIVDPRSFGAGRLTLSDVVVAVCRHNSSLTSESRKEKRRRRSSGGPLLSGLIETLAVLRFGNHASVQPCAGRA